MGKCWQLQGCLWCLRVDICSLQDGLVCIKRSKLAPASQFNVGTRRCAQLYIRDWQWEGWHYFENAHRIFESI
jgi:hypothetical protein